MVLILLELPKMLAQFWFIDLLLMTEYSVPDVIEIPHPQVDGFGMSITCDSM
jgi:hypothetical protein